MATAAATSDGMDNNLSAAPVLVISVESASTDGKFDGDSEVSSLAASPLSNTSNNPATARPSPQPTPSPTESDEKTANQLLLAEAVSRIKNSPVIVPGVTERGLQVVQALEKQHRLDATKISMLLPHPDGFSDANSTRRGPSSSTNNSSGNHSYSSSSDNATTINPLLLGELHDPTGDEEIRSRLEEQRVRFDKKLHLQLQVRLMELQGTIDAKSPSAAFLHHIESGVNEVFGWTEQYQCPQPKYLQKYQKQRDATRLQRQQQLQQHSSQLKLLGNGGAESDSAKSNKASRRSLEATASQSSFSSSSLNNDMSFKFLPNSQSSKALPNSDSQFSLLHPDSSQASLRLHDSTSAATLMNSSQQNLLLLSMEKKKKSGMGYLTGSQTARQVLQTTTPANIAWSAGNNNNVSSAAAHETENDAKEASNNNSSATLPSATGKRWGGTLLRETAEGAEASTTSLSEKRLVSMRRVDSTAGQLLPQLGKTRVEQTVISIAASARDGRAPNYYKPTSHTKPFISSTFGLEEREVCKQLSTIEDKTGPYSQNVSYDLLCKPSTSLAGHISAPQMRRSDSSAKPQKAFASKLENTIYAMDRASLDLAAFRKSELQPLAGSDIMGRSTAADVRGGQFNLATALGGMLGGDGIAAAAPGDTYRSSLTPKRMDVGPGSYFIGAQPSLLPQKHVAGLAYGPTGHQALDERHSYLGVIKNATADNPASFKYEAVKPLAAVGTPSIARMSGRTNDLPPALSSANAAMNNAPPVGHYDVPMFPNEKPPSQQISTAHSEWGFTPRFGPNLSHRAFHRDSQTAEIKRLMDNSDFGGFTAEQEAANTALAKLEKAAKKARDQRAAERLKKKQSGKKNKQPTAIEEEKYSTPAEPLAEASPAASQPQQQELTASQSITRETSQGDDADGTVQPSPSSSLFVDTNTEATTGPPQTEEERTAALRAQAETFGKFQLSPKFLEAHAALRQARLAAQEMHKKRAVLELPPLPPQGPAVTNGCAKDSTAYVASLSQFNKRNVREARRKKKEEREAHRMQVLESHHQQQAFKHGQYASRIEKSNAALHARLSRRQLSSRWFEIIVLASRLQLWRTLMSSRRVYLLLNQKRENAAIKIQRMWRHHQSRIRDAKREIAMRILKRNFKVLFFRMRVRRKIAARRVLIQFFKDVLKAQQDGVLDGVHHASTAAAIAAANANDPYSIAGDTVIPAIGRRSSGGKLVRQESFGGQPRAGGYRRGTVNSVVAVIRHFKDKIKMIQRGVRRYFLLRDAQIEALVRLWDVVWERQRKLFIDYARKNKTMDPQALADHAAKELAKLQAQQQALMNKLESQRAAAAASGGNPEGSNPSSGRGTPEDGGAKRKTSGKKQKTSSSLASTGTSNVHKLSRSAPSFLNQPIPPSTPTDTGASEISNFPLTVTVEEPAGSGEGQEASPTADSSSSAAPKFQLRIDTDMGIHEPEEIPDPAGFLSPRLDPIDESENHFPLVTPDLPTVRAPSSNKPHSFLGGIPTPSAATSRVHRRNRTSVAVHSMQQGNAAITAIQIGFLPPLPAFPQIFQFDRKFTDHEKRTFLLSDWKERRRRFARQKIKYLQQEEVYTRDQCRGLTAAKRLLRHSTHGSFGGGGLDLLDEGGLMTRTIAQKYFRALNPFPVFKGFMNQSQMCRFINACLTSKVKPKRNSRVPSDGGLNVPAANHAAHGQNNTLLSPGGRRRSIAPTPSHAASASSTSSASGGGVSGGASPFPLASPRAVPPVAPRNAGATPTQKHRFLVPPTPR